MGLSCDNANSLEANPSQHTQASHAETLPVEYSEVATLWYVKYLHILEILISFFFFLSYLKGFNAVLTLHMSSDVIQKYI